LSTSKAQPNINQIDVFSGFQHSNFRGLTLLICLKSLSSDTIIKSCCIAVQAIHKSLGCIPASLILNFLLFSFFLGA
jgi:hypothetical protein